MAQRRFQSLAERDDFLMHRAIAWWLAICAVCHNLAARGDPMQLPPGSTKRDVVYWAAVGVALVLIIYFTFVMHH